MSMNREEAIALLNEQYETCKRIYDCSADQRKNYPNVPQFMEALSMALTALRPVSREQVERIRGTWEPFGGKYLTRKKCSRCGWDGQEHIKFYSWCPNCGSPMTDEAVDMVMERLEALWCE